MPDMVENEAEAQKLRKALHEKIDRLPASRLPAAERLLLRVEVKQLRQELDSAFDHDRADDLKRSQGSYQEALRKENLLAAAYNTQVREVTGQSEKTIQYNILKREVESVRPGR